MFFKLIFHEHYYIELVSQGIREENSPILIDLMSFG